MFNNMVFKDMGDVKIYHNFASEERKTLRRFFIK